MCMYTSKFWKKNQSFLYISNLSFTQNGSRMSLRWMDFLRHCSPIFFLNNFMLQIMRDPETGNSKGFAFINFASFDAADAAIEAMNGQHLCNRPISISFAFKKDSKGERHGSAAGMCVGYNVCVFTYSLFTENWVTYTNDTSLLLL